MKTRERSERKSGLEPSWIDHLAMVLGRPWVFAIAFGLLLTPSYWLIAAVNSGAAFLKIGTGARPAAMGNAFTAVADDVDALYYNPGGLAFLDYREMGMTHADYLLDTTFDFAGFAQPTRSGTFGLAITRLAAGTQQSYDANRNATGGFEASDTAYAFSYSRFLKPRLFHDGRTGFGGNLKLLRSTIGQYSAQTVAVDLGVQHRFATRPLSLGASVTNIGRGMQFLDQVDPLPLTVALGGSYRLAGALGIALDVRHEYYEQRTDIGLGTEYAILPSFSLRLGYGSNFAQAASGSNTGFSSFGGMGAGLGFKTNRYRLDYTFSPFGDLGNVQRVSLGARLGK